jgi:hypothetical protein
MNYEFGIQEMISVGEALSGLPSEYLSLHSDTRPKYVS